MHRCQLFYHNQGIYFNEYMQVAKHYLCHDGGSCRMETNPLICSTNLWIFLCIKGTSVMKDSRRSSSRYTESLLLHTVKHNFLFSFLFFFYLAFLSRLFTINRTAGEGGGYLLVSFLPLPTASQTPRQ